MIKRYTRKEMAEIWSDETKFKTYLDVEIAVLEAYSELNLIPDEAVKHIKDNAKINVERIEEIEKITNHDIIAFVEQIGETIGDSSKYFHHGLTSSDIIDTSTNILLIKATHLLIEDLVKLSETLKKKAIEYKDVIQIGRTHGVHAEPITLGFKISGWYCEIKRNIERLKSALSEIGFGKMSGAVGTYSNIPPDVEKIACEKLGLKPEIFSTQIIPRDRYAFYISVLGIIACCLERIALQIRLLQQTEINEVAEPFGKGQKGSSAMPHKRNPVLCERICGLARIIRNNVIAAMENVALWHERDISHSSAERIILPDSTILLDYLINLTNTVVDGMEVFKNRLDENINFTLGLIFSQRVLLALCNKGLPRKDAYEIVQKNAMKSKNEKKHFMELLINCDEVKRYLSEDEIKHCFDIRWYTRNIDAIFQQLK
ncbi:MAG TPA: adenylosuccinate lyase [bacterium]|uniref:Adenylosuccinate lyase n=1 Tax=candidate division TA06 bacterium ADurb.Bin131 TaxID=1852827 RepID=A0A1V6C4W4_UNCT6|nr:MAG: Adenylosuccinate lyase [candidate division TA06 bacterium ADurb.Bin131]HOQ81866.1 adenylosuccinate lyase [bacterium]HPC29862.1 adenylosuccinate lyase [bacterium]HRV04803.1 adenylosuccinate lyase [Candidatus Ratteibacteria bacterium]